MAQWDIKGEHRPLHKIFCNDFAFEIPHYQRPYSWEKQQASELLEDLLGFCGDAGAIGETRPCFLGSIVLVKDDSKPTADVIDGQQRLTTLTILIAALAATSQTAELSADLRVYLFERGSALTGTEDRFRLRLRSKDEAFFREFVQSDGGLAKLRAYTGPLSDPQRRVRENALYLFDSLQALREEQRRRLAQYLAQRCFLVVVSTPDTDSAFRIFSVLNSRGLDLTHADILKSEIIGAIASDRDRVLYADKWERAEDSLGRDAFKDLFAHIRMIHRPQKIESTLLDEVRAHVVKPATDPKKLVDDVIVASARAYEVLQSCEWEGAGAEATVKQINALLTWLGRLDNNDWVPPALLMLQRTDDAKVLERRLALLERLAASLLARRADVNARIRRYAQVIQSFNGGDIDAALQLSDSEKREFVAVLDGELYNEPKVRLYVLLRLDSALGDGAAKYDHKIITVEHVLPQSPEADSEWMRAFRTDADRAWTHRIGNLLLLPRKKNSEASNYDFATKKKRYFSSRRGTSTFALTSQVLNEDAWTPAVIERRQRECLAALSREWAL
jgi:hypothetical protein